LDWINSTLPSLKERGFDNTFEGAQSKSDEFQHYKTGPKAETAAKRPELERLFTSISTLLNKSHRPEFNPPVGYSLQDIDTQWKALEEQERKKEEDLALELSRQEKLRLLVRRFNSEAEELETWASEKAKYVALREEITTLFKASFSIKLFEAYAADYNSRQPRLKALEDLKDQIVSDNYRDTNTIVTRFNELNKKFQALASEAAAKDQYLQAQLDEQQKNENLRFEFALLTKNTTLGSRSLLRELMTTTLVSPSML